MSAIGGVVDFRRGSIDFSAFNKMRNSVSMRGRAGSSAYLDVGVGIFNCSDGLSSCAQPIISERRGYVNAISLDSRSVDASLALERYRTSGVEFLSGLCGDFAIAVYDSERRMLLLARDKILFVFFIIFLLNLLLLDFYIYSKIITLFNVFVNIFVSIF